MQKIIKTYDDKNRVTEQKVTSTWDSSRYVYNYINVPGKCEMTTYRTSSGREQEQSRTVYDLDADGYIDEGNYKRYNPLDINDAPNRVVITKRDKDAAGNTTSSRTLHINIFCVQGIWDDNDNYVCQRYNKSVSCSYTKYEISYY
jgi:hypothetical protein